MRYLALALPLLCLASRPAFAEGFIEGVVGIAIPLEEEEYEDRVDQGFKLGLRAGGGGQTAAEVTADYTMADGGEALGFNLDYSRYRVLIGARHNLTVGAKSKVNLGLRAGVGADISSAHLTNDTFNVDESETDVGLAAELGLAVTVSLGNVYLGGHIAMPMAFHFDDDDPNDDTDADYEYTGIDLDLLFTVGARI